MDALVAISGLSVAATSAVLFLIAYGVFEAMINRPFNEEYTHWNSTGKSNYTGLLNPAGPDIQFVLFTRYKPPYNLKVGDQGGLKKSGFNSSNPTKIIIHGYQSSINEDIFKVNKEAYLDAGEFNVIGMNWSPLCDDKYASAVHYVQKAGKNLGSFIIWLNRNGVNLKDVHLIGHSLGAHVAGVSARHIEHRKIGRITGLDPARPGFDDIQSGFKLDLSDARLVDVIHTYMRFLSISNPLGHVDFYPNGGRRQPGCPDILNIFRIPESLQCNHARAYYLFAESIRNIEAFKCTRCRTLDNALNRRCIAESQVYMGQEETYRNNNGIYYVQTRAEKPFSLPNN